MPRVLYRTLLLPVPPSLWWAPLQEIPAPTLAGRSSSISYVVSAPFPWVLVHEKLCLCPPRMESLLPPVLWKSVSQIPLAFKVRLLGDSQSLSQPRKGDVGPRTFTIVGEFLWLLLFSNFWVAHLVGMGFWFYCDFFFVTRWRYLYLSLVGSSILL